jgi:hypothetical protein
MAGYSGTPLAKKLGIKKDSKIVLVNPPNNYLELLAPIPDGVKLLPRVTNDTDLVHIFSTNKEELRSRLRDFLNKLKRDGMIWVSWPKKAAKVPTDITEDTIREVALPLGLVDIKVCAVDHTWSGLKLVIRKENRN